MLTLLLTALGLSMDAVAVSISSGIAVKTPQVRQTLKMACFFGGFQAVMPLLGYVFGALFQHWIASVDHWIAFGVLGCLGGKMIYEALTPDDGLDADITDPFQTSTLLFLAIATSIDALAVGVTLALLQTALLASVLCIGGVTFLCCLPAVQFGSYLGERLAHRAELCGGLTLIAIGSKILCEHLLF